MQVSALPNDRSAGHLSALLHLVYEAGVKPERWNDVVAAVAASMGAAKALLFTPYAAPQHGGMIFPAGISEETLQLWGSSYIEHDIWSQQIEARSLWQDGEVLVDVQMVPHDELLQSKFYREFLSKIGIARVCAGFVFANMDGLKPTLFSVFRDVDEPAFDAADIAWMKLLVSHVSRSLGVMQRLDVARLRHTSLLASFDRLAFGVVLLDRDMQVVHQNAAARAVLQRNDGLCISADNQLASTTQGRETRELSQWLQQVRDTPPAHQLHFQDGYRAVREQGGRHYVIQCSPLAASEDLKQLGAKICHVAFITDPAALRLPGSEVLSELYGLTRMQALVTLAFADGASYKEVASKFAISEETIRSHVKELYPKLRVNRQADLVRLVLSMAQCAV